jgi:hypothetical protein
VPHDMLQHCKAMEIEFYSLFSVPVKTDQGSYFTDKYPLKMEHGTPKFFALWLAPGLRVLFI